MLTFANKKLGTGSNRQKEHAAFPSCLHSFDLAVMLYMMSQNT